MLPAYLIPEAEKILAYLRQTPDLWTTTYILRKQICKTGDTLGVRRLLKRLEENGAVEADRSASNNTRWRIKS